MIFIFKACFCLKTKQRCSNIYSRKNCVNNEFKYTEIFETIKY